MGDEFRLSHASATTEKAVEAAARVEEIVGAVINGNRKAWARIDVEDVALLVQHARDAARPAASPDWMSKMAVETLAARAEAAEREVAQVRADARVLAGHWFGASGGFFIAVEGLTDTEAEVLTAIAHEAEDLSREGTLAVIRRALEGAPTCSLEAAQTSERRAEAAEAALKQAQDDGRLMLASMGSDMWRRLDGAGRTRLEQELDRSLRDSTEDDGERAPYAELYAYRRLLALGDFFDNPRRESPPVAALPEPEWYTEREADGKADDDGGAR